MESLVNEIPAGDRKIANLFLQCIATDMLDSNKATAAKLQS